MPAEADLDRVFDRIVALARRRDLSDTTLSTSYGAPALKVRNHSFVRLLDIETLVLHCPLEQKILLMEISPDIYFETDHYIGHDVVLIRLAAIGDEELSLRLEDAWRFKAPESVSKRRG
ncbi:MAG: hypothetical protein KIS86_12005 [Devosia sp.]|nr:hypothetical protein [Devosia sp.]